MKVHVLLLAQVVIMIPVKLIVNIIITQVHVLRRAQMVITILVKLIVVIIIKIVAQPAIIMEF